MPWQIGTFWEKHQNRNGNYYPFGLTMAGISSKAMGRLESKNKFQGQEFAHKEFSDGSGLEMYEFKWRMDDPQIGRFWQIDPLSDKYVYNSPYAFSENKVTGHIELEGLESVNANDVKNPYVHALLKDNVQDHLKSAKSNAAAAIVVKGTIGPGVGVKAGTKKTNLNANLSGPQLTVEVNGTGETKGKGSLAGVGLNATTPGGTAGAQAKVGEVSYEDGKLTATPIVVGSGEEVSVKKEVKSGNFSESASLNVLDNTIVVGVKAGIIGVEVSANLQKAGNAVAEFFGAGIDYLQNLIKDNTKMPQSSDFPTQ